MRLPSFRHLGVVAAVAFAASCGPRGGTDVGNGMTVDLGKVQHPAPKEKPSSIRLESGAVVEHFWVSVGTMRFHGGGGSCGGGNADADPSSFGGSLFGDLVANDPVKEAPALDLAAGAYCHLSVDLEPAAADAPPEIAGATVSIEGSRSDGNPFVATVGKKLKLHLDPVGNSPFVLDDGSALVIAFDIDDAVASLRLDDVAIDPAVSGPGGPRIVVDASSDPSRIAQLEKSIRTTASLYRDEDGDGLFDDAESTEGKALAIGSP